MKRKNIIAIALVLLVIGLFIGIILLSSDPSRAPSSNPNIPTPPGHKHKWQSTYNSTEHWWYCHDLEAHAEDAIKDKGKHKFAVDANDASKEKCSTCGYSRRIPTKQDDLNVSFGEDGNASIGGAETEQPVNDLVIPGTVTNPETGEEVDVVEITDEAFRDNNNLSTLVILEGVKRIGEYAFYGCSELKEIQLPASVEYIDPQAFSNCKNLERIIVDEGNPVYRSYTNCIILIEEQRIILGCKTSKIPTAKESGKFLATSIGEYAFCGSGVATIVIPDNIEAIAERAFQNCASLTEFTFSANVTQISGYTFSGCTALKTVTFSDGITQIGQNAFAGCTSLNNVSLPANLTTIYDSAFNGCTSLKNITLNDGLTGIGDLAFRGCVRLESITLPSSILGIGTGAFEGCDALTEIVYKGTEDEWEKVTKRSGWNPKDVEVKFTTATPDTGDSGAGNQQD